MSSFRRLFKEGSVTRAADKLNVTQSAVSNSLARLRTVLADPLVVRNGRSMVPTPRTVELLPYIDAALEQFGQVVRPSLAFEPATTRRTFTLAASDFQEICDVPLLATAFATHMPCATFRVVSPDFLQASGGLAAGAVDAAIIPQGNCQPNDTFCKLFDESGAFVVRRDHPRLTGKISAKDFSSIPQIDVQIVLGSQCAGYIEVEKHWKRLGLCRTVSVAVPNFTAAAMVAARTDNVVAMPKRLALLFCDMLPLKVVTPNFAMPRLTFGLTWHQRTEEDAGLAYFRDLIVTVLRDKTQEY